MEYNTRVNLYNRAKQYGNYIVIGLVSLLAVTFLPFIGSSFTGAIELPKSWLDWCVFIFSRVIVAVLNIIIFNSFLSQAKINIKDDVNFIRANEIMSRITKQSKVQPRSPKKYLGAAWTRKGTTIFVSSILSSFVLAEAILNFNLTLFLSYSFTILMGCIFGYMQMNDAEAYWTNEYLIYAITEEERVKELEKQKKQALKCEPQASGNTEEAHEEVACDAPGDGGISC